MPCCEWDETAACGGFVGETWACGRGVEPKGRAEKGTGLSDGNGRPGLAGEFAGIQGSDKEADRPG